MCTQYLGFYGLRGSTNVLARQSKLICHAGQAARNMLQLAAQCNPSLVEKYFIYMCNEMLKRLKTGTEGMDLMGYVEFQRNYRCLLVQTVAD